MKTPDSDELWCRSGRARITGAGFSECEDLGGGSKVTATRSALLKKQGTSSRHYGF